MIKICALDFLKKETFDTDVMSESSDILVAANEKVSPEILLSLYFKDIYVLEPLAKVKTEVEEEETEESRKIRFQKEAAELEKLGFDEEQGARVAKYALEIAEIIGLDEESSKELEKAAYYHKVGTVGFKKEDMLQPDFRLKVANASYSCLLRKMKFSDKIAEVATLYYTNYEPSKYQLNKKTYSEMPFFQIVAIASYYDEFLTQTSSKEEAIMKMLRLGGNKFNIFVLHKFIHRMRMKND